MYICLPVKALSCPEITVAVMVMEVQEAPFMLVLRPPQAPCLPVGTGPVLGTGRLRATSPF